MCGKWFDRLAISHKVRPMTAGAGWLSPLSKVEGLTCLICFIFVFGILLPSAARAIDPDLVGWWRFDEGTGTTAMDFSGNGNNGTLQGDTMWVPGRLGKALQFDGVDDFVEVPHHVSLTASKEVTVMAWINTSRHTGPAGATWQGILSKSNNPRSYSFYTRDGGTLHFSVGPGGAYIGSGSSAQVPVPLNEWAHVCAMVIGGQHQYYINGENAGTGGAGTVMPGATDTANVVIGRTQEGAGRSFLGMIDDPRIYMRGLTQEEVRSAMAGEGVPQAFSPSPADGAMHPDTWVTLSWKPGDFAVSHDVYLGDKFDDVNGATRESELFRGNQTSTFYVAGFPGYAYPDGLVPGTTYYWRIDEVNDAEPDSPWKGDVWSFSVPPKKAYNPDPADGAELVALNAKLTWTPGFGAKIHTVYFGDNFDTVANAAGGLPLGTASYTPTGLKMAKTYYWRVDEFDGAATHKGDVWSFTTLGAVGNPNPADGAVGVSATAILTWRAGGLAASHEVYFGTDADAVKNATKTSTEYKGPKALGDESYAPGTLKLETAYYWRIDEVNTVNPDSPWKGNVWTFTTGNFFVVDDFESYDAGDNQIWYAWHDGLGYGVPGTPPYFAGNGTGAAVGDESTTSFTEETIVHSGGQAMPLSYDNNKQGFAKYSEAEFKLTAPRDWTADGVDELSIWFRGRPASVGSFVEGPVGTYTMTATGADIWNQADQFHYAYKTLAGIGTIEAQVLSVDNTDPWAKAGVMIRETLQPGSKFAAVYITPANGCRFQARMDTSVAATSDTAVVTSQQTAIKAPYWVKLERDAAGSFRGYFSSNGTTWTSMTWNPQSIPMASNVYVGLALTSHNNNATCTAKFSNVRTTGTVGPQWANQDVGIASNAAEPLYVAVSNAAGQPAVVVNPDSAAAQTTAWTQWVIPLSDLSAQGVNLTNVDKIAVGLGTRGNMTMSGGSGKMYFDDIRLYRARTP